MKMSDAVDLNDTTIEAECFRYTLFPTHTHARCSRCAVNRDETADEGIGSMRYFPQITMCYLYIFITRYY